MRRNEAGRRRQHRDAWALFAPVCLGLFAVQTTLLSGCAPAPAARPDAGLRLYLARHGQTDWNAARKLQGQSDTHLDEKGRAQAAQLAEALRGVPLDAVYSSTLSRSRETAEAARGSTPLTALDGLREQALGKFEGLSLTGNDSTAVAEYQRRSKDPDDALDGGESPNQFFARVRTTVQTILERHPSGTILIVGHGGTNQMILRVLCELNPEQAASIRQANDEIYLIERTPGGQPRLWKRITAGNLGDL